ncbi:hypothetical protein AZE42_11054, partial [Rhizopogon vesiculosus]
TTPPPSTNPFPLPPTGTITTSHGPRFQSPPKPVYPPSSAYITTPTTPDVPSLSYSTSTSPASTACDLPQTRTDEHSVLIAIEWSRGREHNASLQDLLDHLAEGHKTGHLFRSKLLNFMKSDANTPATTHMPHAPLLQNLPATLTPPEHPPSRLSKYKRPLPPRASRVASRHLPRQPWHQTEPPVASGTGECIDLRYNRRADVFLQYGWIIERHRRMETSCSACSKD